MGRQVRKIAPWGGMFESHLHSNHVIHRLYRWTTYHSHPTMRGGHPFKYRFNGRPYIGTLSTPDIIKYKIPLPYAFVASNPKYDPRNNEKKPCCGGKKENIVSAGKYSFDQNCQKMVANFNTCIKNNSKNAGEICSYYLNYLNSQCRLR